MLDLTVRHKYPSGLVPYSLGFKSFLFRAKALLEEGNSYLFYLFLLWEKESPACHAPVPGTLGTLRQLPKLQRLQKEIVSLQSLPCVFQT